jgi:hypothetical protein
MGFLFVRGKFEPAKTERTVFDMYTEMSIFNSWFHIRSVKRFNLATLHKQEKHGFIQGSKREHAAQHPCPCSQQRSDAPG